MLKHLRGKHDQRDHGRRAIGGGGVIAAGRLPSEIQSYIAKGKPSALEAIDSVINSFPSMNRFQIADLLKESLKREQKTIKELTRRYNELQKSGGDLQEVRNKLVNAVVLHEAYREKHNDLLLIGRAERQRVAKDRRRKPIPTPQFASSQELDSVGILGWVRHRPLTPPDYTDYDRDTESFTRFLGGVRKLERTPEGEPVRIIPDTSALETIQNSQNSSFTHDDYAIARNDLVNRANVVADTDVFKHQGESNEDFWRATNNVEGGQSVAASVAFYATAEHKVINGTLRGQERYTFRKAARKIRRVIEGLDAGMRPTPETVMARRGIDDEMFQRMQDHLQVGDRFTDAAFTSTSVLPVFRWVTGKHTMNVIITEGTPTLWTDKKTGYSTEVEVIVGRGTTFEVVSMDADRGIILRTIPPDGDYTPPPLPSLPPMP
jgi:hypothetical protein